MLENTNTKQYYPGPILNTTLEITSFLFRDPEQIKVQKTTLDEEGNLYNIDLNYGTDYEVVKILPNDINVEEANLTASTGQVILKSSITVGQNEKLTVYRESELVQETDYPRTGKFPAASHEGALDYLTMQNQEQQDQIDRALKVPISVASFQSEIPIPEANKALKINSTATGFEFSNYDPDQAFEQTQAYMQAAAAAADAAEASEIAAANSETAAAGSASAAASSASAAAASAQLAEDTVTAGVNTLQSTTSAGVDIINNTTASGVSTINTLIGEAEQAADNAEIWAEGTDEEVQNLGGIHSAKTWAEVSDVSNCLDRTQLSNCILSLTEGSITPQSYNNVSFINHGATYQSDTLSNFSASNFAILAKTMSNATAWTFTLPFTTGVDVSGKQTIVAINNKDNCVIIDNGAIALVYNGQEIKGDVGLSTNTAYVLEFIRTTTGYTVNVKQNETVIDTISITSSAGFFGGKTIFLGNDQSGNYFKGSIGLATSSIYEGATKYWKYGDDIDCQTVEVKGNFQLLMPNGRAANGTMTNVTKTISLDSLILYSPNGTGKTVLVTEDNELMARDSYVESYVKPANPALNSIWYDKTDNELKQQLNTFPNYSVVGSPTISTNGVISNFASGTVQINQSFDLGSADTWEITIPVTTPSALPSDYESITYDTDEETGVNQTHNVVYTPSGAFQFRARRPDVYIVNNEVTVSTAYGVQTGDPEGDNYQTGYVQTSGTAESYVTTGTQIYSDPEFETPLTTAPENTWTYTGQNVNNTQLVTGYVKEAGVTLVPAQTTVYSDANCTSVQATATGTDYTYSGGTAISYICTLSQSASLSTVQTIKVGFNGSQYYLSVDENQQTYNSTDKVNGISSGYHISSIADPFSGSINLNGLTVSLNGSVEWEWNGVSSTTTDFASFVGAKIGKIEDDGTDVTSATLDVPLTIAKDLDVVHSTGDEKIGGQKQFLRPYKLDCRESEHKTNAVMYLTGLNRTAGQTSYTGPSIYSYAPGYDMTDESSANQANAFGLQLLPLDKNGVYWGSFQFYNSYYNNSGTSVTSYWGLRKYVDGALKSGGVSLGISNSSTWFSFPKCTSRPTTTSSAGTSNVDVIVKNYLSGTKGYVQFSSGLKIQWGRVGSTNRKRVTFLTAFNTSNAIVSLSYYGSNTIGLGSNPSVWDINTTGFTAYIEVGATWFAIGY